MNEMLAGVDWMKTIHPDDDDFVAAHIAWLKTVGPDEWHRAALDFNWSNRLDPMLWIVMQDDCDLATALNLFWRSEPGWDLMLMAMGERVREREEAPMIKLIAERIHAGSYTRRKIAFDPEPGMQADYDEMLAHCARIPNPPFRPHPDMLRSIHGGEVINDADFYRRQPDAFHGSVLVDLPPWDGVTSGMEVAAKELRSVIFNLGIVGVAVYWLRFVDWQNITHLAGLALLSVGLFLQLRDANKAAATVRGLMRAERHTPSRLRSALIAGGAVAAGYGLSALALQAYFALEGAGLIHDPAGYGKIGVLALSTAALWGTAWLASRILVRKFLFR